MSRERRASSKDTRQLDWNDARRHAVHRLKADWWEAHRCNDREPQDFQALDWRKCDGSHPAVLPRYVGWPTAGPSLDTSTLKLRQAQLKGHVDWVCWSKECRQATHRPVDPARDTVQPVTTWCTNYGKIDDDGKVKWPVDPPIGKSRSFISSAIRSSSEESRPCRRAELSVKHADTKTADVKSSQSRKEAPTTSRKNPAPATARVILHDWFSYPENPHEQDIGTSSSNLIDYSHTQDERNDVDLPMCWAWNESEPKPPPTWTSQQLQQAEIIPKSIENSKLDDHTPQAGSDTSFLDAQRSWALLRCAYLAGAESIAAPHVDAGSTQTQPLETRPFVNRSLDEASWLVRSKLESLRKKTAEAGAALQRSIGLTVGVVSPAAVIQSQASCSLFTNMSLEDDTVKMLSQDEFIEALPMMACNE